MKTNKRTAKINSVCEQELFDKLDELSKKTDNSYSTIIRKALREYINKELPKE